jgi:hypothetical protein
MKKKKDQRQSKIREKINQLYEENELANLISNKSRARSITVGTAFGGAVEIAMRGDYHDLWATLQPVEVVELIEQLSAGIGLQIAMRPKQDFATWRGWNVDADDRYWAGAAPWQIEDASYHHKKFLKESRTESKLLSAEKTKPRRSRKKISEDNHEVLRNLQNKIRKDASEDLEDFREDIISDRDSLTEMITNEINNLEKVTDGK